MPSQPIPLNFIKGDKMSIQTDYLDSLPENMYAVPKPILGASGYMLQHEGLSEFGTAVGPDRGGVWNERLSGHFRVSYSQFIIVASNGSTERFGDIPGMDQVSMPYSFNTQAVIGGGNFYLYDPVNGFRQVLDENVKSPIDGVWIDGYYFLTDGEYLYHTDLNDESVVSPLAFATAEFSPDPTIGLGRTADDKVIAWNRYTTEFFANVASSNFAFTRIQARALKIGMVATHAKCELNQNWYFTGSRKEGSLGIHMLGVGDTTTISTRTVETILSKYTDQDLQGMSMEARSNDGLAFVIVHLPGETLLFNETIAKAAGLDNAWSVLKRGTGSDTWRGINGVFDPRVGKWIYGDKADLRLGALDPMVTSQYGQMGEWVLYTPYMYLESMSIDRLTVETIPGQSVHRDATLFLSITYDGMTWGKETTQAYGSPGDYNTRYIVNRLGYVRNWCAFKMRGASLTRMAFGRGYIEVG